jgi:hypothetical protein
MDRNDLQRRHGLEIDTLLAVTSLIKHFAIDEISLMQPTLLVEALGIYLGT